MLAATVIGAVLLDVLFLNNTAVGTSVGGSCRLELRTLRITQSQLASVALQEPPSGQTPTGPAGGEKDKDKSKKPSKDKSKKPPKNSPEGVRPGGSALLYDRLGKKEGITAVVNEFVSNVGADQRINKFFAKTDLDKLKMHLVNQICEASGGP